MITAIAAIGRKGELGNGNELLWHIPDDLKRFKALTVGHPCIMGRKTFESIMAMLGKPLPGRTNIVLTRDSAYSGGEGVIMCTTLEDAIEKAKDAVGSEEIYICGGAQIYAAALPYCDRLQLTLVDDAREDADAFFPEYGREFTNVVSDDVRENEGLKYRWVDLRRGS